MAEAGDKRHRSEKRRRRNILQKRVSDTELEAFKRRASAAGFPDHREYLSTLIFGEASLDRRERQDLIKILGELGKHGSNLNQIAHAANSGKITSLSQDDLRMIDESRTAIQTLGAEIREALK
jgi:uncharacterized tellurite resistance protein B-like protein